MARFNNNTYRSLNESIAHVQNPQAALNEALEYNAALEAVLLSLCEELDLDPRDLMEGVARTANGLDEGMIKRAVGKIGKKLKRLGQTLRVRTGTDETGAPVHNTPREKLADIRYERGTHPSRTTGEYKDGRKSRKLRTS
jgi:hypothetical protein